MHQLLIGVDVDGVLADFVKSVLDVYNDYFDGSSGFKGPLTHKDITSCEIEDITGDSAWKKIIKIIEENHACYFLDILPGAREGIKALSKFGKVAYVTSPFYCYNGWCEERFQWLEKYFDAKKEDIVFATNKNMFIGDLLIDDNPKKLIDWAGSGRYAIKINRPWNENCSNMGGLIVPAISWNEVIELVEDIKPRIIEGKSWKW